MKIAMLFCLVAFSAAAASFDGGDGGAWKSSEPVPAITLDASREGVSNRLAREIFCDEQPIADQASERIPTATHTGKVNTRFQWIPGYMDVPIYLWKKYHVRVDAWLQRHQAFIFKYLPVAIKDAANWESYKNYVIVTVVGALKYMHKF